MRYDTMQKDRKTLYDMFYELTTMGTPSLLSFLTSMTNRIGEFSKLLNLFDNFLVSNLNHITIVKVI